MLPHAIAYGKNQKVIIPGKLKGAIAAANTDGLTNHEFINTGCDILKVCALHERWDAAGDFDVFDGASHFALRLIKCFAALQCNGSGDVVQVFFKEVFQGKEILDALDWRVSVAIRGVLRQQQWQLDVLLLSGESGTCDEDFSSCRVRNVKQFIRC